MSRMNFAYCNGFGGQNESLLCLSVKIYGNFCDSLKMSACSIEEISGDLFSADKTYSLAHCVAADMRLGKGIALKFRDRFGQIAFLKQQNVKQGGVAVLKDNSRFIYNLVTKQSSWGKPTYQLLQSSLEAMRDHMLKNGVTKLAMPRIGCGLDGLKWEQVQAIIKVVFEGTGVKIRVYVYSP